MFLKIQDTKLQNLYASLISFIITLSLFPVDQIIGARNKNPPLFFLIIFCRILNSLGFANYLLDISLNLAYLLILWILLSSYHIPYYLKYYYASFGPHLLFSGSIRFEQSRPDQLRTYHIIYVNNQQYSCMSKQRVIIVVQGAQSTGKSTLINKIMEIYPNATVISEVARSVIQAEKITNQQLQNNINGCFEDLQYKILLAQFKKQLQPIHLNAHLCISDRCVISPLVYTMFYFSQREDLINKIQNSPEYRQRMAEYKSSSIVFLLLPQQSIIKSDGVRKQSTFKQLQQITKLYKEILQKQGIKYYEINQLKNRQQFVRECLKGINIQICPAE